MAAIAHFVLRAFLLLTGLVVAASVAVGFVLLVSVWVLRSTWLRLTGRRAPAFIVRQGPRRSEGTVQPRRVPADVTDVEPHAPRG